MSMQQHLNLFNEKLKMINMKIYTENTKIMVMGKEQKINGIRIDRYQICISTATINNKANMDDDINQKFTKTE